MDSRKLSRSQKLAGIIAVAAIVAAILLPHRVIFAQSHPIVYLPLDLAVAALAIIAGLAVAVLLAPAERATPPVPIGLWGVILIVFAAAVVAEAIGCILFSPSLLTSLVIEDGPAEVLQAILLFAGAGVALVAAATCRKPLPMALSIFLGLTLLVIGGEEVSWFQRVLGFETPDWLLQANAQRETNLHNIVTDESEAAYYVGAIALLVFIRLALLTRNDAIEGLVPTVPLLAVGVLSSGLNYEVWPGALAVLSLALSCAIALTVASTARERGLGGRVALLWGTVALTLAAQLTLALSGSRMERAWDNDEVRETLIAAGLFGYACLLAARARALKVKLSAAPVLTD